MNFLILIMRTILYFNPLRIFLPVSLVIGAAVGLIYGWVVEPARTTQAAPASLRTDFQEEVAALIASAHAATGDLPRARARLALLPGGTDGDYIAALAQAWVDGVTVNNGVIVLETSPDPFFVASRETGASTAPQLVINF